MTTPRVWIQLAECGSFKGHPAGPFELNPTIFSEIVANFKRDSLPIIVDAEHCSEAPATSGSVPVVGAPAMGWIHALDNRGTAGLWGHVEWLEPARSYIKEGRYKYISPAVRFNCKDRVTGQPIGARLSSAGITGSPFLRTMAPLIAASDKGGQTYQLSAIGDAVVPMKFAHSSHEYMPRIRACLRLGDLATAAECSDAMSRLSDAYEMGGGAMHQGIDVPGYLNSMRDMMSAPMGSTIEDLFEAVQAMIDAAIEEHEAVMHPGEEDDGAASASMSDDNEADPAITAAAEAEAEATIMSDTRIKELEGANAVLLADKNKIETTVSELTLRLKDEAAKVSTLEAEVVTLRDEAAKRADADLKSEVNTAFETYKDVRKLSDSDKGHMLTLCKAAPEAFRSMYPVVDATKRHLMRDLTVGGDKASAARAGGEVETTSAKLTIVTLADKLQSEDKSLDRGEAIIRAEIAIRTAARAASHVRQ